MSESSPSERECPPPSATRTRTHEPWSKQPSPTSDNGVIKEPSRNTNASKPPGASTHSAPRRPPPAGDRLHPAQADRRTDGPAPRRRTEGPADSAPALRTENASLDRRLDQMTREHRSLQERLEGATPPCGSPRSASSTSKPNFSNRVPRRIGPDSGSSGAEGCVRCRRPCVRLTVVLPQGTPAVPYFP